MPDYAIRVELPGDPTWEQYDTLHKIMAKGGFLQTVAGVDSQGSQKTFNLPHAVITVPPQPTLRRYGIGPRRWCRQEYRGTFSSSWWKPEIGRLAGEAGDSRLPPFRKERGKMGHPL